MLLLFSVSLGASGVGSLVSLIGSLTEPESLGAQHVVMNGSQAPGRPLYDLMRLQLEHRGGEPARCLVAVPRAAAQRASGRLLAGHVSWLP